MGVGAHQKQLEIIVPRGLESGAKLCHSGLLCAEPLLERHAAASRAPVLLSALSSAACPVCSELAGAAGPRGASYREPTRVSAARA